MYVLGRLAKHSLSYRLVRLLRSGQTHETIHRNISQHCWVMLWDVVKQLANRTQHFNATYRIIIVHNMLHAFGHPVAACWMAQIELVCIHNRNNVARTWPNIMQHPKMLQDVGRKIWPFSNLVQYHATCATGRPNDCNMLCATIWDMLHAFGRAFTLHSCLANSRVHP